MFHAETDWCSNAQFSNKEVTFYRVLLEERPTHRSVVIEWVWRTKIHWGDMILAGTNHRFISRREWWRFDFRTKRPLLHSIWIMPQTSKSTNVTIIDTTETTLLIQLRKFSLHDDSDSKRAQIDEQLTNLSAVIISERLSNKNPVAAFVPVSPR